MQSIISNMLHWLTSTLHLLVVAFGLWMFIFLAALLLIVIIIQLLPDRFSGKEAKENGPGCERWTVQG
jgi:hypothetical protein